MPWKSFQWDYFLDGFSRKAIEVNVIKILVTILTTFRHLKILHQWNIKEEDIKKDDRWAE